MVSGSGVLGVNPGTINLSYDPEHPFSHIHNTKKRSFPLMICSVNVTKSAVPCGFGHIF